MGRLAYVKAASFAVLGGGPAGGRGPGCGMRLGQAQRFKSAVLRGGWRNRDVQSGGRHFVVSWAGVLLPRGMAELQQFSQVAAVLGGEGGRNSVLGIVQFEAQAIVHDSLGPTVGVGKQFNDVGAAGH